MRAPRAACSLGQPAVPRLEGLPAPAGQGQAHLSRYRRSISLVASCDTPGLTASTMQQLGLDGILRQTTVVLQGV